MSSKRRLKISAQMYIILKIQLGDMRVESFSLSSYNFTFLRGFQYLARVVHPRL